jgi:hypothetical protein
MAYVSICVIGAPFPPPQVANITFISGRRWIKLEEAHVFFSVVEHGSIKVKTAPFFPLSYNLSSLCVADSSGP